MKANAKKRRLITLAVTALALAAAFLLLWNVFGLKYVKKEFANQYPSKLTIENELDGPTVYLPDEYTFYGRYALIGETYGPDDPTEKLSLLEDRMVYRQRFEHRGEAYYLYYSNAVNYYDVTYPDVYGADGEKAARLRENPEGCFVDGDYLYYAYGKDYYNVRVFTAGFLTGHEAFARCNYKDYAYARLNLGTMMNEDIAKGDFEAKYNDAIYIGTPKP